MVTSVVNSTPKEWKIVVVMDWSQGFWQVMTKRYPRVGGVMNIKWPNKRGKLGLTTELLQPARTTNVSYMKQR